MTIPEAFQIALNHQLAGRLADAEAGDRVIAVEGRSCVPSLASGPG